MHAPVVTVTNITNITNITNVPNIGTSTIAHIAAEVVACSMAWAGVRGVCGRRGVCRAHQPVGLLARTHVGGGICGGLQRREREREREREGERERESEREREGDVINWE